MNEDQEYTINQFIDKFLFNKDGRLSGNRLKQKWFINNNYQKYYNIIVEQTKFLDIKITSLKERLYCIYNKIYQIQYCKHCKKNPVEFRSFSYGYNDFCCYDCAYESKQRIENHKKTLQFKYGNNITNISQLNSVKEKRERKSLENRGCKNPAQDPIVKDKIKMTVKSNWGEEFDYYLQTPDKLKKTIETSRKIYGTDWPTQSEQVKEIIRVNNRNKRGCDYHVQEHLINIPDLNKEFIEYNFLDKNKHFDCDGFQIYFNCSPATAYKKLQSLDIQYKHKKTISDEENQLYEFLLNYLDKSQIVRNTQEIISPFELDMYLPEYNVAIEYNGLFWHCEVNKPNKNYHLLKTIHCNKQNIRLFHIFEHEWVDVFKRNIWESMILSNLGFNGKIYARKCNIDFIDHKTKNEFLQHNHIQGKCQSSVNIGLFYEQELVSVMTFSKTRYNKNFTWELLRFCTKKYHTIIGGFSKLLKYFRNNYNGSIVTYADLKYSNGDVYRKNGFTKGQFNRPSYFYCKNYEVLNRMQTQKNKLSRILKWYNSNLTEKENMINNGWNVVWDCGTIQFYMN